MKAKQEVKQVRKVYNAEFKKQAVNRTQKDGVPVTAKDLGLHESPLYAWRHKARLNSQTTEEQKLQLGDNARLKRDVARLSGEVAFLKKAAAYFARLPSEVRPDDCAQKPF